MYHYTMLQIVLTSLLLGVGLAMDACAVSMANGMKEPNMKIWKRIFIAFLFGLFQAVMPLIGYAIGSNTLTYISWIIPYIALALLSFIGIKMLVEGIKHHKNKEEIDSKKLTIFVLLIQAIATSIDALTVGFSVSNYTWPEALICFGIIFLMTFAICIPAVFIGKKFGVKFGPKAEIAGGIILIAIGLEIFISGVFF